MKRYVVIFLAVAILAAGGWFLIMDDSAQSPRDVVGYNDASSEESFRVVLETEGGNESFNFTLSPGEMDESKEFPTTATVNTVHVYHNGQEYTEPADKFDTCPKNSPGDVKVTILEDTVDTVFICR